MSKPRRANFPTRWPDGLLALACACAAAMPAHALEDAAAAVEGAVEEGGGVFNTARLPLLLVLLVVCGAVIAAILFARTGRPLKIRKLAALEAVDEAVGRA
ncbi:MAG: DUF6754 domain-containing protein, partial [Phycisphaerales bacterium]